MFISSFNIQQNIVYDEVYNVYSIAYIRNGAGPNAWTLSSDNVNSTSNDSPYEST